MDETHTHLCNTTWPDGTHYKMIHFANERVAMNWERQMLSLKRWCTPQALAVFRTDAQFLAAQQQWVRDCRQWTMQFGSNTIPLDMREKINAAEVELGWERTFFGADEGAHYQRRS